MSDYNLTDYFWWLYDLSLLETMEIALVDNIKMEHQTCEIYISSIHREFQVVAWHGVAGHE